MLLLKYADEAVQEGLIRAHHGRREHIEVNDVVATKVLTAPLLHFFTVVVA
jgi:hypothetical protein